MDVIGVEHERDHSEVFVRRRPAAGRGVLLAAAPALTAAVIGFLLGRAESTGGLFDSGTVGDLTGAMLLELQDGAYVQQRALSDQVEYRGEDWKGTITLEASGTHSGAVRLRGSASYVPTDFGPVVAHMWGTAAVTLDGQSCTGTYGFSSYRDSGEGGGSMYLRCDEGTVLGATMTADHVEPPTDDLSRDWTVTVALEDGYLLEP